MMLGLWLSRNLTQIRSVMVVGSTALLALSAWLTITFIQMRHAGNTDAMLFTYSAPWFPVLHIAYSVGVDGISVVMLLLSSIIVFTGTFASWQLKPLTKEYFLWFVLLSIGVYGFFISTDLFTMFMFYEVALIPMYLLIGVWGSGNKEYAAMKLTLMLMGGSALLIIGILGIYFFSGATTMNIPICIHWFRRIRRIISFPHMVSRRSRIGTYSSINASCRCTYEVRRLRMFSYCHVFITSCCQRNILDIPYLNNYFGSIWCLFSMCSNRLKVYQCLFFGFTLWSCTLCIAYDDAYFLHRCSITDAFSWFDDCSILCTHRYDLW